MQFLLSNRFKAQAGIELGTVRLLVYGSLGTQWCGPDKKVQLTGDREDVNTARMYM